jgi:hypothetical protein
MLGELVVAPRWGLISFNGGPVRADNLREQLILLLGILLPGKG